MNKALVDNHNQLVKESDLTYHLGDFSLSEKYVQPTLSQMNGSHIIIVGNHDGAHRRHKNYLASVKRYLDYGFKAVHQEHQLDLNQNNCLAPSIKSFENQEIQLLLSHLPYLGAGDHTIKDRYDHYRPIDTGKWLLCGHVHNSWKIKNTMINVGVDVWDYKPVSLEEILQLILTQSK